jgi:hypothetical protein
VDASAPPARSARFLRGDGKTLAPSLQQLGTDSAKASANSAVASDATNTWMTSHTLFSGSESGTTAV